MSKTVPLSNRGPTNLMIYDIHALQERFYFGDKMRPILRSGISSLLRIIESQKDDLVDSISR